MKTSFLNYYKTVLEKVSFDKDLLMKEYNKAMNTLTNDEQKEFHSWFIENGLINQSLSNQSEHLAV